MRDYYLSTTVPSNWMSCRFRIGAHVTSGFSSGVLDSFRAFYCPLSILSFVGVEGNNLGLEVKKNSEIKENYREHIDIREGS